MKIINKLNSIIKIQIFICLVLSTNFGFANTDLGANSNAKHSITDLSDFNDKTNQDKKENIIKASTNNNFHEIMSTKGGCTASCCAGNSPVQKVDDSKKKSNRQNIKKKFVWFSRSK